MNAHIIRFVRLIRLDGRFCLHEIDVLPDFLRAHILVQIAVGQEQDVAEIVEGEVAACTRYSVLPFSVAVNDPLDPFSGNAFGVIHHLHQNEFAVSAVGFVHVENGVSGGAGTSEGVKNYAIWIRGNLKNSCQQTDRFRIIKNSFP